MKTNKKNVLKFLVLLLAAVFVSQTLCFSTGSAMAEVVSIASSNSHVTALASTEAKELKTAQELATWLSSGTETNVVLAGGVGTIYDLSSCTYNTKSTFTGTFDGGYCTIIGVTKPLLGTVTNATIKNVYIGSTSSSPSVINSSKEFYMGAIAQKSIGAKFINCINTATINVSTVSSNNTDKIYVGGIVGHASGATVIDKCSNHASITAGKYDASGATGVVASYAGGIVGYAEGTTKVTNSYVAPIDGSSTITIRANAKTTTDTNASGTVRKKNDSTYYNGLTHIVTKVNEDLQKVKNDIAGYQSEASALQRSIDSLKSQINNLDKQIASIENTIKAKTKEADNSAFGWKWSYMWAEIAALRAEQAGIRVAQGALWVSVGAVEAARATVYAAITAAQALLEGMAAVITYSLRDTNWLNVTSDATKTVTLANANAYGIGFFVTTSGSDSKAIKNSYTYKVQAIGGFREATYKFPLKFWSTSEWLRGTYSSADFTNYVKFREENYYGPITNNNNIVSEVYYYTAPKTYQENRYIFVDDNNYNFNSDYTKNTNFYGKQLISVNQHSVHVSLEKQKLIYATSGKNLDELTMLVNNGRDFLDKWVQDYAGLGTKFQTLKFDSAVPVIVGNGNTATKTNNLSKTSIDNNLTVNNTDSIWRQSANINNGYPYIKDRYWQES